MRRPRFILAESAAAFAAGDRKMSMVGLSCGFESGESSVIVES